jgi:tetratricopeptide (TPR) repeat protein
LEEEAVTLYRTVTARFPDSPLAPQAQFLAAHGLRELGEHDAAMVELRELVGAWPDSVYRHESRLLLGNHAPDEGDLGAARRWYEQLVAEAPDDMAAVGWYRLGWVAYNEGSCKEALSSFEEAIDRSPEAPGDAAAARVARDALVDATFCYAQVGEPDEAAGWIRSRARTRGDHIAALERLTRRYAVLERAEGVAPVLRTLLAMAPDAPERVDDIRLLHRSLVRSKDFRHVGEDVATLLTVLDRRTALPELDDETRDTLRTEVLDLAHDLSLRAQRVLTDDGEGRTDAVQTAAA